MRHLFIINKNAGKSKRYERVEKQLNELDGVEIRYTEHKGHASEIAEEAVKNSDDFVNIYACGGDGTINEVLSGVYKYDNCAVAPVPVGTGNDFIRSFGIDADKFLNLADLMNGRTAEVDLLRCGDKISANSITVGFDCAVAKNVDKFKRVKLISSSFAYKLSIFYCLLTKRRHNFRIIADGEMLKCDTTYLLSVCAKGKYYGGGIKCAPLADNSDGMIDFMYIPTLGVLKFVSLLSKFVKGQHIDNPKMPFVYHSKFSSVKFESDEPFEIGVDGEIYTVDAAEITILKKAQKIILPK